MERTEMTDTISAPAEENNTMWCNAQPWLDTLGKKKPNKDKKKSHKWKKVRKLRESKKNLFLLQQKSKLCYSWQQDMANAKKQHGFKDSVL